MMSTYWRRLGGCKRALGLSAIMLSVRVAEADEPPISPDALDKEAAALEDTAAYLETAESNNLHCSSGQPWSGRGIVSVRVKMTETCGPWRSGDRDWQAMQNWSLRVRRSGSQCATPNGGTPASWAGYCTICPVPYSATIAALRSDAQSLRERANEARCLAAEAQQRGASSARSAPSPTDTSTSPATDSHAGENNNSSGSDTDREQGRQKRYADEARDADDKAAASGEALGNAIADGLTAGVHSDVVTSKYASVYHREWALFGAGAEFVEAYVTRVPSQQMRGMPALGVGIGLDLGLAPVETRYFGLELEAIAWSGGLPNPGGGFYLLSVGARASVRLGLDRVMSVVGVGGVTFSYGGFSLDCGGGFTDCSQTGTTSVLAAPLGGGLKICTSADDASGLCTTALYFLATRHEVADVQGPYGSGIVGELDLATKSARLQAWLSPDYPRPGVVPPNNTPSPGWMGGVTVTFFGFSSLHPYGRHADDQSSRDSQ